MERGSAHHHKITLHPSIDVQFTYLQAVTANMANPTTASGSTVPAVHFELRQHDSEQAITALYFQFHQCVMMSRGWTEAVEGNQYQEVWRALSMTGPTASGYIA